jgi:hypothetical protein
MPAMPGSLEDFFEAFPEIGDSNVQLTRQVDNLR